MIGLSPSLPGTVQLTCADVVAGRAVTPVGGDGATGFCGVTAFDRPDAGPEPVGLIAWTVNWYVVPVVRPEIVAVVSGGLPVIVVAVWAWPRRTA